MSYTRLQLANRALVKLQVVGAGQSPEADDTAKANDVIPAFKADLEARDIYSIPDLDEIEDAAFEWLADLLAYFIAPDFSMPRDEGKRQIAEAMMKRQMASGPSYEPLAVNYF